MTKKEKFSLVRQYDPIINLFHGPDSHYNKQSTEEFLELMKKFNLHDKKLLDIGCGDGADLASYMKLGAECFGLDSSKEQVTLAQKTAPKAKIQIGLMEQLPYPSKSFDIVTSKYVLQTSEDVPKVLAEVGRVLRPKGLFMHLTVHPMRQFIEKKKKRKDYFKKELVDSILFEGKLTVKEPSHTFNEYLSEKFLKEFDIEYYCERPHFPAAEQIEGDVYPCYFILIARKR